MAVKRYNGSSWDVVAGVGAQGAAATSSTIATWVKTASGGETSVSGNDDNSQPLSYTIGQELVFINGVLQKRGADYTANTGNSITGLSALTAGDIVSVWTVNAFSVSNAIANTIVDAKGDILVGTAADTPGRLAVGTDGYVLTADSTTGTGLKWAAAASSFSPNAVINGGFDIWQRGTSSTITDWGYVPDRWFVYRGGANTTAVSRQATGDTTNLPNIQYCARVGRTSGSTTTASIYLAQSVETVNSIPFVGKTVTLSFYARKGADFSSTSNALTFAIDTGTGTDQNNILSYTGLAQPGTGTATLTSTWQRFSCTGTIATNVTEIGMRLYYTPTGTAGTNDYFEITGVQLEVGSVATPFSRAQGTIAGELAA